MHQALNAHKVNVTGRIECGDQGEIDSHAQNIGWQAVEFCAQVLHDWKPNQEGAHAFWLGGVQSLTRGERVGKMKTKIFRLGKGGDHILGGKGMTSKKDKWGRRSYDKRYVPNFKKPHMCLITALGTLLLTRKRGPWKYLFMDEKQALKYEKRVKEHAQREKRGKETRSRAFGPHVQFDKIIARTFNSASNDKKTEIGISLSKNVSGHSKKSAGFQQALDINKMDIVKVATRAEHNTGNFGLYGARSIKGVVDSGGPPARDDILMAKALAGRRQYTSDFNSDPPHWDNGVVKRLTELLPVIVPCYEYLAPSFKPCVPLLIAQNIYHYHVRPTGMSEFHPLFQTPLWTTHQSIRQQLFDALRGGDTCQKSVLSSEYADKDTEVYLWQKATHELAVSNSLQIKEATKAAQEASKIAQICFNKLNALEKKVSRILQGIPNSDAVQEFQDDDSHFHDSQLHVEQWFGNCRESTTPSNVSYPPKIETPIDNNSKSWLDAPGKVLNIEGN
jgi:hypothetical protein